MQERRIDFTNVMQQGPASRELVRQERMGQPLYNRRQVLEVEAKGALKETRGGIAGGIARLQMTSMTRKRDAIPLASENSFAAQHGSS